MKFHFDHAEDELSKVERFNFDDPGDFDEPVLNKSGAKVGSTASPSASGPARDPRRAIRPWSRRRARAKNAESGGRSARTTARSRGERGRF